MCCSCQSFSFYIQYKSLFNIVIDLLVVFISVKLLSFSIPLNWSLYIGSIQLTYGIVDYFNVTNSIESHYYGFIIFYSCSFEFGLSTFIPTSFYTPYSQQFQLKSSILPISFPDCFVVIK